MARLAGRTLRGLLLLLGAVTLIGAGGGAYALLKLRSPPSLPQSTAGLVLRLDLTRAPTDAGPMHPVAQALNPGQAQPRLRDVIEAIDRAARDSRIQRLEARVIAGCCGSLPHVQEIRAAVLRFRASGKPTLVHAESFGESQPGTAAYYLASAFRTISMPAIGSLQITGLRLEAPFAAEALAMLGVEAQFGHRGDYKSGPETWTNSAPSPANLAMLNSLADDLFGQVVDGIASARNLDAEAVQLAIDHAPLTAPEALQAKLIDSLAFERDAFQAGSDNLIRVSVRSYLAAGRPSPVAGTRIAMIYASGGIEDPDSSGPARPGSIAPRPLAAALARAIDDTEVRGILLRLDTQGGSPTGSALVGAEIERARRLGKPVVVSMMGYAASGGYWIASHAAGIVAHPASLTGSIGVYAGKINFVRLMDTLQVHWAAVERGANASINSPFVRYGEREMERLNASLDNTYRQFLRVVGAGRGLSEDEVLAVAGGRVWTGRQALERKLVDRLGGLEEAEALLREKLGLPADAPLDLQASEPAEGALSTIVKALMPQQSLPFLGGSAASSIGVPSQLSSALSAMEELGGRGALSMMPLAIR
ncbi:S49 family peptidase [Pseudoroseomonas sp. WGS1072]|uniref:S49 family peptidase n=1 Tax=Roseomonas sp. WGS1072 TaxID=3366816 RepID=UPI003BF02D54